MTKLKTLLNPFYAAVRLFQKTFGHPAPDSPTPLEPQRALKRSVWTGEEIVEFLHASVGGNEAKFLELFDGLIKGLEAAKVKQLDEGEYTNKSAHEILTRQGDAGVDMIYFVMGTFVEMGLDPTPLFDIVQAANMGKLGPDGKPIIRESDGKIMKPENWERDFAPEPKLRKEVAIQMNKAV